MTNDSPRTKAKQISTDLEQRVLTQFAGIRRWLDEHSRLVILATTVILVLNWANVISIGLPAWWPLGAAIVIGAAAAAYVGGGKVAELIPDEDGILLVTLRADQDGGAIYELSEDEFAEMFTWGSLYQWPNSPRRVYEARAYDDETNTAVGNWRESMPASAFLSEQDVEDAMGAVRELRQDLEPEAAKAKEYQRRFRGIARRIDAVRTRERFTEIDEVSLDRNTEGETLQEIIDQELPEDLHPDAGGGLEDIDRPETPTDANGHDETAEIDIELDAEEPL